MPPVTSEQSLTDSLIALKSQYERSLSEVETQASHLREQLSHVNALLLNQLVPTQAPIKSAEPALTLEEADAQVERLALAPAATEAPVSDTPKPNASPSKPKAAPEPVLGKRSPRPLLPAYEGLTRLEAIAQLLQATPGQDVTTDQISERLFGKLSAADHKAERKSLNTQLYKGQSLKLWQKGTAPGTFTIGALPTSESVQPTTEAPAPKVDPPANPPETTAPKRKSLTLLPAYAGLTKREAIAQVLTAASGEVLHHDTIIQTLYGDLSPEELKDERVRIKTALLTGVKDERWQKAFEPSSYFIKATAPGAKPKRPGRNPEPSKEPKPEPVAEDEEAIIPAAAAEWERGKAKPRTSLTLLPAFEGLSKREAIAQVLEQYSGEALHQDTIIQTLYGDLSIADLKAERSRMDTALRTGVKDQKWQKASVPASYVMATASKAKAAKPKPGRKPTVGKAKASKSKRTEAELLEILQKADIQV
jgi:hypothetical protein